MRLFSNKKHNHLIFYFTVKVFFFEIIREIFSLNFFSKSIFNFIIDHVDLIFIHWQSSVKFIVFDEKKYVFFLIDSCQNREDLELSIENGEDKGRVLMLRMFKFIQHT